MSSLYSVIIDENQLSSGHNILSTFTLEIKTTKTTPPTTIDQNSYC